MKKWIAFVALLLFHFTSMAQCAICTKTASQLGEGPAKDLNAAILYLMFMPLIIMGVIGYKWYKKEKQLRG
jgi:hypothetical protein